MKTVATNKIKLRQIDLSHHQQRNIYSEKLKVFEQQFSYPLNPDVGSFFKIAHGNCNYNCSENSNNAHFKNEQNDYFSFFEQMGQPVYIVATISNSNNNNNNISDEEQVVGAGCAILVKPASKSINHPPYWYLCDFKIAPEFRGQGILGKMLLKYLFPNILKSHRFLAINMSARKLATDETAQSLIAHNGLLRKLKNMFSFLPLGIGMEIVNLHQWTKATLPEELKSYAVFSNQGKKDFMLHDNEQDKTGHNWDVYHLAPASIFNEKYNQCDIQTLDNGANLLHVVKNENDKYRRESLNSQAVLIYSGVSQEILSQITTIEI